MIRDELQRIRNFAVYYGNGYIHELCNFDMVIIEPTWYSCEAIEQLKENRTIPIGYVGVTEVLEGHSLLSGLTDGDFLMKNGERMVQEHYGGYLVDLTSTRWQGRLINHVGSLLIEKKFDGIFLDTIANVERTDPPFGKPQFEAAVSFVENLRKLFPQAILIQNNGLEYLCHKTAHLIDAIIWENPPIDRQESQRWVSLILEQLESLSVQHLLKVLLLFEKVEKMSRRDIIYRQRFADIHKLISYFAESYFQNRLNVPGRSF